MSRNTSDLPQVELLISSLKKQIEIMDRSEFPTPSSCCIYKVLPQLRKMNEAAYTPVSVSIGPYHHGNKGLESMEEVKLWFLYKFLKRTQDRLVDTYVHLLKDQEAKIRRCYSETIPMKSDKFVWMILTDACFIIEYFILLLDESCWHPKLWSMENIGTDLILLENQLPFFVLKDLFRLAFPNGYNDRIPFEGFTFVYLRSLCWSPIVVPNEKLQSEFTLEYFVQHNLPEPPADGSPQVHHLCDMLRFLFVRRDDLPRRESSGREMNHCCDMLRTIFVRRDDQPRRKSGGREMNHLCDMLRTIFVRRDDQPRRESRDDQLQRESRDDQPRRESSGREMNHLCDMLRTIFVRRDDQPRRERSGREMKPVYSVSKLYDAGIKFEVNEDEINLLELKFSKGVLKIPKISICDITEAVLRNVVAYEQYHFLYSRRMTDYVILLEYLIRTENDVEILSERGIIQNIRGENDAVASMTKRLGWNTIYSNFNEDYIILFEELNKFCDSSYHKYKAIFKQQYWSTPWRIASFLGAILLLLLTLIQTISSVIALFQK